MRSLLALLLLMLYGFPVHAGSPPAPGADARCPVCGMFVAPYPQWLAVLALADGRHAYFDGPKDLFRCYADLPDCLPGATAEGARLYVTDYYTLRLFEAGEVFFVVGSNVLGPMGQEPVPVAGRPAAETFLRDHAGSTVQRFDGRGLVAAPESP